MTNFNISAEKRTVTGKKVKQLRREGIVPGTIYGPKNAPMSVQFPYRELETTLRGAGGTNVIDIVVDGDTIPVLARDVQRDILKGHILHVDFLAPDMNTKIRADIPLVLEGRSPLVEARKGIMLTGPNSISLEMLPSKLMDRIVVDVSVLDEIGATIAVKDLPLAEGITVINDPEEMIARIVQPSAARAADMAAMDSALAGESAEGEGEEGEGEEGEGEAEEQE